MAKQGFLEIKERKLRDKFNFQQFYIQIKEINLVYYENKIENQILKKKIEIIGHRAEINSLFKLVKYTQM